MNSEIARLKITNSKIVAVAALVSLAACATAKLPEPGTSALASSATSGIQVEIRAARSEDVPEDPASFESFLWQGEEVDLGPPEIFTLSFAERGLSSTDEPMGSFLVHEDERERYLRCIVRNSGRRLAMVRGGEVLMLGANNGVPTSPRIFSRDDDAPSTPELDNLIETVTGRR